MSTHAFFVPGTPVGQGRISHGKHGRGYHSNGKTLKPWREKVAGHAKVGTRLPALLDGPLELIVTFWLPRGKTVRRPVPSVRPDLSHLVRAVEDALTGVLWTDDALIVREITEKRYADDTQPLGCDIEVTAL